MTDSRGALEAVGRLPDAEIDIGKAAIQLARVDAPDSDGSLRVDISLIWRRLQSD
jgi:hypothetical protein